MAGERIRHNTSQMPVNTTLENVAWGFLLAEMAVVTLLWVEGWYWLLYTSFVLLALLIIDWAVIIFINWRLGKIRAYENEMKGYAEEQSNGALVRDFIPDAGEAESAKQFNAVAGMWSDLYEPPYFEAPYRRFDKNAEPLAGATWPDHDAAADFTDTSKFRAFPKEPLSNTGEEHDVGTDADKAGILGIGTDTGPPPGAPGEAGPDGGAFGQSWGTGGWSHASGDGGHRVPDDGPSTVIDLHARSANHGEDEPTTQFDPIDASPPPGLDVRGIRFSEGRSTRQPVRRDDADQDARADEWEGLKDYPS